MKEIEISLYFRGEGDGVRQGRVVDLLELKQRFRVVEGSVEVLETL